MSVWTLLIAATLGGDTSCAAPAPGCTAKSAPVCQSRAAVNCHPCPQAVNPCVPCPTGDAPCSSCDPSNVGCDSCCIPDSNCCSKACKHSTCNLYPHYPYFPQCHGYYYFRPYNWVHIDQHRLTIPGENVKSPYSNAMFDRIYAGKDNLGEIDSDQPRSFYKQLPKLESLLK